MVTLQAFAIFTLFFASLTAGQIVVTREPVNSAGRVGDNVQVNCTTVLSGQQQLEWWFNGADSQEDQQIVVATPDDVNFLIQGYAMDSQRNLIIEEMDFDQAGKYTCQIREFGSSDQYTRAVEVMALGPLELESADVLEGEEALVTCSVNMTGLFYPRIRMFEMNSEVETYIISRPDAPDGEFRLLKYGYNFTAMDYHNDLEYRCDLMFTAYSPNPSYIDLTYVNVTVFHGVMDIKIDPNSDSQVPTLQVGELLNCSARGEPEPEYFWTNMANATDVRNGSSLVVTENMIGRNSFTCTAHNMVNGTYFNISKTVTFDTVEAHDNGSRMVLPSLVFSIMSAILLTVFSS